MKFDKIDWNRAFFKTYVEKRSFGHLLVNFNRVWVTHISMFWFYTAYNSPTIYSPSNSTSPERAMTWSVTGLGGAVATLIEILATIYEFSYIPTTWNNTSHLTSRLVFLLVVFALTAGPTVYIAGFDDTSNTAYIISIVQFFVSVVATVLFAVLPTARLFGSRVSSKSRKYLANQTFTAAYPKLDKSPRAASIMLWVLVFGCKFTESYFFLTLSFRDPIRVMSPMRIQNCSDKYFGDKLCRYHTCFTLAIMFVMDLVLFFLDTFLWFVSSLWLHDDFGGLDVLADSMMGGL